MDKALGPISEAVSCTFGVLLAGLAAHLFFTAAIVWAGKSSPYQSGVLCQLLGNSVFPPFALATLLLAAMGTVELLFSSAGPDTFLVASFFATALALLASFSLSRAGERLLSLAARNLT